MTAAIKGGREAEALEEEVDDACINVDEVASGGRRRPTTPTTIANAANVDDDEATSGGHRRPTKAPPAIASGGCLRSTIVVETVNEDGATGEEFSLASEDDFATKDDDDEEEEDPKKRTAVPRARQRAAEAHLPTKPKLYSELWSARRPTRGQDEARRNNRRRLAAAARAGDDARSNKEADFEANRQTIEKGAGKKAAAGKSTGTTKRPPTRRPPPRRPTTRPVKAVGHGAPKCCRRCLVRQPAKKPRGKPDRAEALLIFCWAPMRRRRCLVRPEAK